MSPRGISFRPACVTMPRLESRIDAARESHPFLAFQSRNRSFRHDLSLVRNILYRDRVSLVKTSRRRSILDSSRYIFDRGYRSCSNLTRFKFIVSLSTSGRSSYTIFVLSLFVINVSEKRSSSEKVSRKNTYARRGREFRSPCSLGDSEGSG